MQRAYELRNVLNRLLAQSNHSSIHKSLNEGGEASSSLIEEALRLKASGEESLAEEDYMQAAIALQAALDKLFDAIRVNGEPGEGSEDAAGRLAEAFAANDTFISAAERVVAGDSIEEALSLLASAHRARTDADSSAANGEADAALELLANSTELAQKAITVVRDGMVIERSP